MKFTFQCPQIKVYRDTAAPVRLHMIYGWPLATITEVTSYNRDCMRLQPENIYSQALYRKSLPVPNYVVQSGKVEFAAAPVLRGIV